MIGFQSPNHTQTPNDLFDVLMASMGDAELRVVLVAVRKTLGFHRKCDAISLTQFEKMSGLSRQGVVDGLEAAAKRGLIKELPERGKRGVKFYELVFESDRSDQATSQASRPVTSQASRPDGALTSQASRHTKEKDSKEKEKEIKDSVSPAVETAAGDVISELKPPKKEREPNPWYDAVFEVWGFTAAKNTGYANMLQGKGKAAQYKKYNIEPPLESPERLKAWARWWRWKTFGSDESKNMLESTEGIQSSIGQWRALGEPDPAAFTPTPLFEAVRLHVFGISDPNARGEQMERIAGWLSAELDGGVGKLSASAAPQHVAAFAGWYRSAHPTASFPRDLEKFANNWRTWAKSRKQATSIRHIPQHEPELTAEERRARWQAYQERKQQEVISG